MAKIEKVLDKCGLHAVNYNWSTKCKLKGVVCMGEVQLGVIEARFADIIWQNEPVSSSELVKLSEEVLKWKKSTTFTVLRRLCEKGLFKNEKSMVTSLISKEEFYSLQSEKFVEENFDGSLPAFLAAFTSKKKLSQEEVEYLRRMVMEYEEE